MFRASLATSALGNLTSHCFHVNMFLRSGNGNVCNIYFSVFFIWVIMTVFHFRLIAWVVWLWRVCWKVAVCLRIRDVRLYAWSHSVFFSDLTVGHCVCFVSGEPGALPVPLAEPQCQTQRRGWHGAAQQDQWGRHRGQPQEEIHGWLHLCILCSRSQFTPQWGIAEPFSFLLYPE